MLSNLLKIFHHPPTAWHNLQNDRFMEMDGKVVLKKRAVISSSFKLFHFSTTVGQHFKLLPLTEQVLN